MADPAELYKNFAHINDVQMQGFTGGGYGLSSEPQSHYQHTSSSWDLAGQDDSGQWHRYYFIQVDSMMNTGVAGTFKINGYFFTYHLVDASGQINPATQLIAVTPDSTEGSTSYTTSMSETFSASGGFFGETPTASVGASATFGHSVTRSVPDINIINTSLTADGQNASWTLGVAEVAAAQHGSLEFTTQMLFRVPSGPGDPAQYSLKLQFTVAVEDHDDNGTAYHDETLAALTPHLGAIQVAPLGDRGCYLNFPPLMLQLKTPAIPQPALVG